jgi:hypothetical protein
VRQAILSRLPFLPLHSDVRDVVYVSWLVDAQLPPQQLLPAGVLCGSATARRHSPC